MRRSPPGIVIGFAPERLRQPQGVGDTIALLLAELKAAPAFDVERRPGRMQPIRQSLGVADQTGGARIFAHANQNTFAGGPRAGDGARLHLGEQLLVNAFGGAA